MDMGMGMGRGKGNRMGEGYVGMRKGIGGAGTDCQELNK